jgi:hypothetical protein
MKRLLVGLVIAAASVPVLAQHRHLHHHGHGGWGYSWVAPTIIGGVIGYEIARNQQPVIVQQPTMIVQQPPLVIQQSKEVFYIDGIAYRKQVMIVNGQYQEVLVRL